MLHTVLLAILAPLLFALAAALIAVLLRPRRAPDPMQQAIGDAPVLDQSIDQSLGCWCEDCTRKRAGGLPRGGYAALDEQAPIQARRPS